MHGRICVTFRSAIKKLNITDEQIKELVNKQYVELSSALRYEIETSGVQKSDLL